MYTREELLSIAENHNISEKYHDKFVFFALKEIDLMLKDNELDGDSINDWAVKNALHYINLYDVELKKGHSKEWAEFYAFNFIENDGINVLASAYNSIKKMSSLDAKDELIIHCNALGEDEFYTKHFIF